MGYKALMYIAFWGILNRKDRKSGFHIKASRSQGLQGLQGLQGSQRYNFFYICDRDRKDPKGRNDRNDRKVLWFPYDHIE